MKTLLGGCTLLNKERVARACMAVDAKERKNSFQLGFLGRTICDCVENSDGLVGSGAFQLDLEQKNLEQVPWTV